MTSAHAFFDAREQAEPASTRIATAIEAVRATATGVVAARLFGGLRHRWTMRQTARLSDHRLRDIGFERDWDGSVPLVRREW